MIRGNQFWAIIKKFLVSPELFTREVGPSENSYRKAIPGPNRRGPWVRWGCLGYFLRAIFDFRMNGKSSRVLIPEFEKNLAQFFFNFLGNPGKILAWNCKNLPIWSKNCKLDIFFDTEGVRRQTLYTFLRFLGSFDRFWWVRSPSFYVFGYFGRPGGPDERPAGRTSRPKKIFARRSKKWFFAKIFFQK